MRRAALALVVVFGFGLLSAPALLQQKGGGDETGVYDVVSNWPQPFARQGYIQGSQGGVFAESPNRIFVANRGEVKLPKRSPDSPVLGPMAFNGSFGSLGMRATTATSGAAQLHPRRRRQRQARRIVDPARSAVRRRPWAAQDQDQSVPIPSGTSGSSTALVSRSKFSNDGKRLGDDARREGRRRGSDEKHFGRPTDIAFLPDGTFFVSDGYDTRATSSSTRREVPRDVGTKGTGPGQFNLVHCSAVDANGGCTRSIGQRRIQVFDENGKFLDEWPDIARRSTS